MRHASFTGVRKHSILGVNDRTREQKEHRSAIELAMVLLYATHEFGAGGKDDIRRADFSIDRSARYRLAVE
jgi:hypothetical protein